MGVRRMGVSEAARAGRSPRGAWAALAVAVGVVLAAARPAIAAPSGRVPAKPPVFEVGAAQESITPTSLVGLYLGGYGIGPMHPAKSVLRPIYAHAMAIRSGRHTVVFAAIDVQGWFSAYQQGPYGLSDVRQAIAARFHIPADNIVISSTHTHNGPDGIGVWGGVPTSYLAFVAHQLKAAIANAILGEQPARLVWGTEDVTGMCKTFGTSTNPNEPNGGDQADYPIDNELRVLQARAVGSGRVIATMVNFSCHATVYGPLDEVSPDWPGATVTYLEHTEQGATGSYGFPGSQAIVMVGAVGHTWPAGVPARFARPAVQLDPKADDNYPADHFGNAVGRAAVDALAHAHPVWGSDVGGVMSPVAVVNDNPVLGAFLYAPVPGYHIDRSTAPPYTYGDVLVADAGTLRVGDLAFYSVPGEAYPSLLAALHEQVRARAGFLFSLAQDQLGYVLLPADLSGAAVCSTTDEFFFTISPAFGAEVVRADRRAAAADGFEVVDPSPAYLASPGPVSTNCVRQQLPAGAAP
jgi:hypothetical protein